MLASQIVQNCYTLCQFDLIINIIWELKNKNIRIIADNSELKLKSKDKHNIGITGKTDLLNVGHNLINYQTHLKSGTTQIKTKLNRLIMKLLHKATCNQTPCVVQSLSWHTSVPIFMPFEYLQYGISFTSVLQEEDK